MTLDYENRIFLCSVGSQAKSIAKRIHKENKFISKINVSQCAKSVVRRFSKRYNLKNKNNIINKYSQLNMCCDHFFAGNKILIIIDSFNVDLFDGFNVIKVKSKNWHYILHIHVGKDSEDIPLRIFHAIKSIYLTGYIGIDYYDFFDTFNKRNNVKTFFIEDFSCFQKANIIIEFEDENKINENQQMVFASITGPSSVLNLKAVSSFATSVRSLLENSEIQFSAGIDEPNSALQTSIILCKHTS